MKGQCTFKNPLCPVFRAEWKKGNGGGPAPITLLIMASSFCNCQNKKERPGSLLSNCPTLHESDTGPLWSIVPNRDGEALMAAKHSLGPQRKTGKSGWEERPPVALGKQENVCTW